jgi:hypothetical protein
MNTMKISTAFSPFQLQMGCSPRLIPPLTTHTILKASHDSTESVAANALIERLKVDVAEAQDNLLVATVTQAEFASRHHMDEDVFKIGDKVMLSMEHLWHDYI